MDTNIAIELTNVCKTYKVTVEDDSKSHTFFNKKSTKIIENIVFDNLNLKVKKGEMLGIIGLNGSGKSTLLSIIARIMEPDSGIVETNGKVASILELGMGFHADLTGRENIYLKGEMYGFSKSQMDEKIDEIIEFSGIKSYIDNPLRTYSSGMSGRLAFSIMVHVDAEIMVLDEIMSTGDASFAAKADNLFKKQLKSGKTVVFASQSFGQIEQLCTRTIWINKGKIVADGPTKSVCALFNNTVNESLDIISDFANSGVPDSQYKLALLYRDGVKVEKDLELYRMWLERAASQGHTLAQVAYADLLMLDKSGEGSEDAFAYYQSAALKGNADAKLKLSSLVNNSRNVKDLVEIRQILKQLAEIGHPSNKYQYATLMLQTAWNDLDREESLRWYTLSAEEGNPDAMYQLAIMHRDGIGTVKNISKYEEYLIKGSEIGHLNCIRLLADTYLQGKLVIQDEKKAFNLYLKGSEMGNGNMQYQVAVMYRDGIGVEKNQEESNRWFTIFSNSILSNYQIIAADQLKIFPINTAATMESLLVKAADTFNLRAINMLGALYRGDGFNIPNFAKAKDYYIHAAKTAGVPKLVLADMYYRGYLFEQNYKKAAELYKSLSYCCDSNIDFRLYLMYHNGLGFEKDDTKALFYLKRSAVRGNNEAQRQLRAIYKSD